MKRILVLIIAMAALATACSSSVFSLAAGDCFNDPDAEQVSSVETVECTETHDNEVYSLVDLSSQTTDDYPGEFEVQELASESCLDQFEGYVGLDYESSKFGVSFLTPSDESWDDGDREVVCFLFDFTGATLNATAQNSGL